jgi:hypothetical protein
MNSHTNPFDFFFFQMVLECELIFKAADAILLYQPL